jgi:hypothetical protein
LVAGRHAGKIKRLLKKLFATLKREGNRNGPSKDSSSRKKSSTQNTNQWRDKKDWHYSSIERTHVSQAWFVAH